jgi:hypothetical protein
MSRIYELMRTGELESYQDGRSRRIPMAAITDRIARQLAAADSSGWRKITSAPPPRRRGRPRKV